MSARNRVPKEVSLVELPAYMISESVCWWLQPPASEVQVAGKMMVTFQNEAVQEER